MSWRGRLLVWWLLFGSMTLHGELRADVGLAGTAIIDPLASDGSPLPAGRLVLVVVDRSRDGFAAATAAALTQGDALMDFMGDPDDVVVASLSSSMVFGRSAILGGATVRLTDGIDAGDPFAIIFFDQLAAGSLLLDVPTSYAVASDPSWVVPSDGQFVQYLNSGGEGAVAQLSEVQTDLHVSGTRAPEVRYVDWAQGHFGDAMRPDAQPAADPDGDLFSNLFEYAFGMDPTVSSGDGAPSIRFERSELGETLTVEYTRVVGHTEVEIGIEVSSDLLVWDRDPDELREEFHEASDGVEHCRLTMALGASGYRFVRFVGLEPLAME